jgi:hypothetical protein
VPDFSAAKRPADIAFLQAVRRRHAVPVDRGDIDETPEDDGLALQILDRIDRRLGLERIGRVEADDAGNRDVLRAFIDRVDGLGGAGRRDDVEGAAGQLLQDAGRRRREDDVEVDVVLFEEALIEADII